MKQLVTMLVLIIACQFTQAQDVLGELRDEGTGYAQVTPGKRLKFPRDHGAHPEFRIEWWYLTANLNDADGRSWGIQWTLFRQALSPQPVTSGWNSNQVWMAHAAITTPDGHYHEQRFARGGIGQAGVTSIGKDGYFNAWLDDWEWRSAHASLLPAQLKFSVNEREVVFSLDAEHEPVANGIEGYSQKSAQGQASYYYSQPFIRVTGQVRDGDSTTQLSGQGWLDREWSSQALAPNQQGWDWFSLHLNDGHKLMVYRLRHEDGEHWLSGNWISPTGESQRLDANSIELKSTRNVTIKTDDKEQRELPLDWQIVLGAENRSWFIQPLYDQQWMATRIPYWEGVVLVEDDNGKASGIGYMELTGYE